MPAVRSFRVRASLFDVEHNFHAEMAVDVPSGRIEDVQISMTRRPYPTLCPRALENAQKLKGMMIGPGITRKIIEAVGRSEGCVHMVELFAAAVGFYGNDSDWTTFRPDGRRCLQRRRASAKVDADSEEQLPGVSSGDGGDAGEVVSVTRSLILKLF